MDLKNAIQQINKNGILLVFPVKNNKEPNSIWRTFYPRKKMVWEWNEDSDDSISEMWLLMKKLSDCKKVVYSKWYQGRATFFSRKVFVALLSLYLKSGLKGYPLTRQATYLHEALRDDSPLSTKQLKEITDLQGKLNEPVYTKSMKQLFSKFLVIAFGEVEDGAFPSLAVGATENIYEDLWKEALSQSLEISEDILNKSLPEGTKFRAFFDKHLKEIQDASKLQASFESKNNWI